MSTSSSQKIFDIISAILSDTEDGMAGPRFQDPKIERSKGKKRQYYFIRPYAPIIGEEGRTPKRKPLHLGWCDEITKAQAKAYKQDLMAGINAGRWMAQSQVPFTGVLRKYRELAIPDLGPESRKTYERHIRLHIEPFFGRLRMFEMTRPVVKEWLLAKEQEGLSHNTLLDLRKVLSAIFSRAHEWRLWDGENPCSRQKVGGIRPEKHKALPTIEGLLRFLGEIRDSAIVSAEGARLIVLVAVATGLRVGEVLGLRPRALNGEKEEIKVEESYGRGFAKPTKTEGSIRSRQAPGIVAQLMGFAKLLGPGDYIFGRANTGGFPPDDRDLQQHVFRPAAIRAGIYTKGFGMHRFRHLNISWRQEVGATPFEAQKSAGHSQPSTTWLYTQTDAERERTHVKAILDRLMPEGGKIN